MDKMTLIFKDLSSAYPGIALSLPFEDMVRYSFDRFSYNAGKGPLERRYGEIRFEGSIRASLCNFNKDTTPERINLKPDDEERRLNINFDADHTLPLLVYEDRGLGHRLLPFLEIVAKHSNPFFGFLTNEADYDFFENKPIVEGLDVIRDLFTSLRSNWGSLFLETDLAASIGYDVLDQWAELRTDIGGIGHYIERGGVPLFGNIEEDDRSLNELRNDLFAKKMYPKIIARLVSEYGISEN